MDQGNMLSHDAVAVSPWAGLSTRVHEWETCARPSILPIASHFLLLQMPVHTVDDQNGASHHLSNMQALRKAADLHGCFKGMW